jgi:hypothetical protein
MDLGEMGFGGVALVNVAVNLPLPYMPGSYRMTSRVMLNSMELVS